MGHLPRINHPVTDRVGATPPKEGNWHPLNSSPDDRRENGRAIGLLIDSSFVIASDGAAGARHSMHTSRDDGLPRSPQGPTKSWLRGWGSLRSLAMTIKSLVCGCLYRGGKWLADDPGAS
jgi:hypothetical protein